MSRDISPNFVPPHDPILIAVAPPISPENIDSPQVQTAIERMLTMAYGEQTDRTKPVLVGLAAPQIGLSHRIILVDIAAEGHGQVGDLRVYINPEITHLSDEQSEWYEGCYSTAQVCGVVSRPHQIKVKALNQAGEPIEEDHSGYTARIFQHEIDHLNGIEFMSHITDDAKLHWVEDNQYTEYRNGEAWRRWPHLCSRERWHAIKNKQPR